MRERLLIIALLVIAVCISCTGVVYGESESGIIESTIYGMDGTATASGGVLYGIAVGQMHIPNIHTLGDVNLIKATLFHSDYSGEVCPSSGPLTVTIGSDVIGTGEILVYNQDATYFVVQLQFDNWDRGSYTGEQVLTLSYSGAYPGTTSYGSYQAGKYSFWTTYPSLGATLPHQGFYIYYSTKFANGYVFTDNSPLNGELLVYRSVDGIITPSRVFINDGGAVSVNEYAASGNTSCFVLTNPISLNVLFDGSGGNHSKIFSLDTPWNATPTSTPTPTATPTPGIDLCQYWSLSLNTSNINRNEAVLGTLTETDPDNRYDMIDWYRVLPNGAEYIAKHYIYDSGLFGLGAGWFLVDSYTGYTEASSVDEALENEIDFTTSGGAHYVRVRIYDDKSLLPLVYHDYDHVCTKEAIVYVAETTQSLTQQGINVYEADTNAFLSDVSLSVYDYGSGEWQNKTSSYGSTTYFNAVPGHNMRVLANKTGWLSSDSTFTVANPPVTYAVYLKRPLPDIVNKSYVFFNVRDSVTHTGLYQATIQLSDGQLQSTLPSGYAGFSVNDSESYYYTVSKPGYQTLTSTFSISEDTTIPVLLVQIAPTPTVTLPITTLPTVTVTGTLTPTVTGTTTLTATATGTYSNATLAAAERVQKTTKAADVWYTHAETLSNLLFLAVIVGVLGLMSNAMDKRRRRR